MERYGIIDLGSNSVRLNIVEVFDNGGYNLLDQAKVMVRLSENLQYDKMLKPEPMNRTIHAIRLFKKLLNAYEVKNINAVATAAVRIAQNGIAFLDRVESETGVEFKIITGQEEAFYDYLGVVNSIAIDNYVMIDIGGGSTEIALIENRKVTESVSLPFGSVILTEVFMKGDREEGFSGMEKHIQDHIKKLSWLKGAKGYPVIGMGGVVRTIGKIHKQKKKYPAISLHNYKLSKKDTFQIIKKLMETGAADVAEIPGASKERADILGPGVLPLRVLMDHIGSEQFIVSGNGLRDGLFYEMYFKRQGIPLVMDNVLDHSLVNVMKRYHIYNNHSQHVAKLSLELFEGLKTHHDFTENDRKLLYVAAMLHDIGMHIEYYNHHRHGFYLTINSRVYGIDNEETIQAAFLVAMHREAKFKEDMEPYKMVVDKIRLEQLKKLSFFLRMAEKLDRSESQVVKKLKVDAKASTVNIQLISDEDMELEKILSQEFGKEFEERFGSPLLIS